MKLLLLLNREVRLYKNNWLVLTTVSFACMLFLWIATTNETFVSYSDALPIVFAKSCAAILIGLNMSINMICKDFAIIRSELLIGISAISLIFVKVLLLILLCITMSTILIIPYILNVIGIGGIGVYEQNTLYLYFAVFFTMFTAAILGLAVSAFWHNNPQRAALVIPFIMLFQILFSGFVFEQVRIKLDSATISNYAIRTIGSGLRFDNEDFKWDAPSLVFENSLDHAIGNLGVLLIFALTATIFTILVIYAVDKLGIDIENT